jgi:hypothetical protein
VNRIWQACARARLHTGLTYQADTSAGSRGADKGPRKIIERISRSCALIVSGKCNRAIAHLANKLFVAVEKSGARVPLAELNLPLGATLLVAGALVLTTAKTY